MSIYYSWKRYWIPSHVAASVDESGFLIDPESYRVSTINAEAASLDELESVPLLILLGEPGMGKSTELTRLAINSATPVIHLNLRNFESFNDLLSFLGSRREFAEWKTGSSSLTLILDSLDEALIASPVLADRLAVEVNEWARDANLRSRLRIRIASRTASWPQSAEATLRAAWGTSEMRVLTLAPLVRRDAEMLLQDAQRPSLTTRFGWLDEFRVGALAARPVTLRFLASVGDPSETAPSHATLYERGCLRLVAEPDLNRLHRASSIPLLPQQRLAIAARLAAITVFSNRSTIDLASSLAGASSQFNKGSFDASWAIGGSEFVGQVATSEADSNLVEVNLPAVREVLSTPLFGVTGRETLAGNDPSPMRRIFDDGSDSQLSWAHQSFAEFLAARWVVQNRLNPDQVVRLFIHRIGGRSRIPPQLHQTAAWLAGMDRNFLRSVAKIDPSILVRSDIAVAEPSDRANLVNALLDLAERDELEANIYHLHIEFRRLGYPTLDSLLLPILNNASKPGQLRLLALKLAAANSSDDALVKTAVRLALDEDESATLRYEAIGIVADKGSTEHLGRLYSILVSSVRETAKISEPSTKLTLRSDADDQLRGVLLRTLWRKQLRLEEVFNYVTPPRREVLYGSYKDFVYQLTKFINAGVLEKASLAAGLRWISEWRETWHRRDDLDHLRGTFGDLAASILRQAWHRQIVSDQHETSISRDLARVLLGQLKAHAPIAPEDAEPIVAARLQDQETRQSLVQGLVDAINAELQSPTNEHHHVGFALAQRRLLLPIDIEWLVHLFADLESEQLSTSAAVIADAIGILARWGSSQDFELAYRAAFGDRVGFAEGYPDSKLAEVLAPLVRPIALGSEEAINARELSRLIDQSEAESAARASRRDKTQKSIRSHIDLELTKLSDGDLDAWWRLNRLTSVSEDWLYFNETNPHVTTRPFWSELTADKQSLLVEFAKKYLLDREAEPGKWINRDVLYRPAWAGFNALRLLQEAEPEALESLTPQVWQNWASVVVGFPLFGDDPNSEWYRDLIGRAYRHAPDVVVDTVRTIIRSENAKHQAVFVLDRVDKIWELDQEHQFGKALLEIAKATDKARIVGRRVLAQLLTALIKNEVEGAREYAESLIARVRLDDSHALPMLSGNEDQPETDLDLARSIGAAEAMATICTSNEWKLISQAMESDTTFARELATSLASRPWARERRLEERLTEGQLQELYELLASLFPPGHDVKDEEAHWVTPIEEVADWRDNILRYLAERGTPESVAAIRQIRSLRASPWINQLEIQAERTMFRENWIPLAPREIIALGSSRKPSLIKSSKDLGDLIVASLGRFQTQLRGPNASINQFWDNPDRAAARPKPEEVLSNAVAFHLRREFEELRITTAREVRIRPRIGDSPAEDVDIQIDAFVEDGRGGTHQISALVEIKGHWFKKLSEKIRTQLVDRYMSNNPTASVGIFLVGWYGSSQWDPSDRRRLEAKANAKDMGQLIETLNSAARRLSNADRDVRAVVIDLSLDSQ
jgi:hypothetical protein